MAYWNGNQIIRYKPKKYGYGYKGWWLIDCGCCGGLRWGGDSPKECTSCRGDGFLAWHKKSGVLAEYPGGPFLGRVDGYSKGEKIDGRHSC